MRGGRGLVIAVVSQWVSASALHDVIPFFFTGENNIYRNGETLSVTATMKLWRKKGEWLKEEEEEEDKEEGGAIGYRLTKSFEAMLSHATSASQLYLDCWSRNQPKITSFRLF